MALQMNVYSDEFKVPKFVSRDSRLNETLTEGFRHFLYGVELLHRILVG